MNILDKYPNYSEQELATLTKAACQVLTARGGAEVAGMEAFDMSSRAAATEIAETLKDRIPEIKANAVQQLFEDRTTSSDLALNIIGLLRSEPNLANLITAEYEHASKQMSGVEIMLSAALVVLACKISKLKVDEKGLEITFTKYSDKITDLISLFLPKG